MTAHHQYVAAAYAVIFLLQVSSLGMLVYYMASGRELQAWSIFCVLTLLSFAIAAYWLHGKFYGWGIGI